MSFPRISQLLTKFCLKRTQYLIHRHNFSIKPYLELKSINNTHATIVLDGKEITYDWIFLRDSCQCHQCIDPSTKQKLYRTTDIPLSLSPQSTDIRILNNHTLEILWKQPLLNQKLNDIHRSVYSNIWLETYSSLENIARARYHNSRPIYWNRNDIEQVNLHINCDDYLYTDQGLYLALKYLHDYGIVFIDNVQGEFTVEKLTERIGEIRQTFYGKSWDVKSMEKAINIAYTSKELDLHMDLLYMEAPPGLQLLHSLKNNVKGGESYYVDSFSVAETLRRNHPEYFHILCSYPVTFHYRNINRHYHYTRSTIVLDRFSLDKQIDHINYSPPFQAPFESDTSKSDFRLFLQAFKQFQNLIQEKNNRLELILEKDQCVIFNNRRVLHARREFDPSTGERWLKGCYTDLDNFKDRLRIYREKFSSNIE